MAARVVVLVCGFLSVVATASGQSALSPPATGADLYRAACSTCHGVDGKGAPQEALVFEPRPPDFTDCRFAPREPDQNWLSIIHRGGPARGFNRIMPSFQDALTTDQIRMILGHVRTLCTDKAWPRGDLNFPKALATEKAFPEDELLITTTAAAEGSGAVTTRVTYERRFGAQTQIELGVPVSTQAPTTGQSGPWVKGVGDVAFALKRVLVHNLERGHVVSASAEFVAPTGSEAKGLGGGTAAVEPFLTYGQRLPGRWFVQAQSGAGIPWKKDLPKDVFWRASLGRSFIPGRWGRMWSPMVEVLGGRELVRGEPVLWDVLPEMQVTLSTRQHVRANVGVRFPINDAGARSTQVLTYLLWDWYDGPFFKGW
jgi:mono/diheme cytochrome c family protein